MTSVLYCALLLCFDPGNEPAAANVDAPIQVMTAKEFCELSWCVRTLYVMELESKLENAPKTKEWRRMTDESKRRFERGVKNDIGRIQANREIDWNHKYPDTAKAGEAFKLPRSNKLIAMNDEFEILEVVDETSVLVRPRLTKVRSSPFIIEDLKPTEFIANPKSRIKLSGLWYKVRNRTWHGDDYQRISRWPHQQEVEKMWPKFLEAQEKESKLSNPTGKPKREGLGAEPD